MKKLIILFITLSSILLGACDKESYGDQYGLTGESLAPYVEITSKAALSVSEGKNATIALRSRTALQTPVTINYQVSGAFARTGSVTLPIDATTVNAVIAVPTGVLTGNETSKNATFKLVSAVANGQNLTIGLKGADAEVRTIKVIK